MPRRKLTEEEKEARRQKKAADQEERSLACRLDELQRHSERCVQLGPPVHTFKVGDRVTMGNHDNTEILEVVDDRFYKVKVWGLRNNYGKMVPYVDVMWRDWFDLEPFRSEEEIAATPIFSYREDVQLNFMQSGISSLTMRYQHSGVDMSPEYQREHVWKDEHRVDLIESVFNNIDIGKFVFRDLGWNETGPLYEIIDGKQRLTTLMMFAEGRLRWRGRTIFELHPRDQSHFELFMVQYATISENVTLEQILRLFLKLNTGGVAQDPKHLAKVQRRLEEIENERRK